MTTHLLVVPTSNVGTDEIEATIGTEFGSDIEVKVVAPASGLSRLDWLTNAEDDARDDARERAHEVADALPTDRVTATAGDTDPLLAIEDALREFPADQIVMITRGSEDSSWLENGTADAARERFDVPVLHLVV